MKYLSLLPLLGLIYSCQEPQLPAGECNPLAEAKSQEDVFTLQLLHLADQEGNINALEDAPGASSVINSFKNTYTNSLTVSAGDNYLLSVFSKTSENEAMRDLIGEIGFAKADMVINNELGIQVSAIGNHEFDRGPDGLYNLIKPENNYVGANFPYLSANIEFSNSKLNELVTKNDQEASQIPSKIANTTIIDVNGRKVGFIGAVTQELSSITSTGKLGILPKVKDKEFKNLAAVIQGHADRLTSEGIDVIVLLAHMQQLEIEEKLAGMLKNVDIIVGGGSDSILVDENDRMRPGHSAYGDYPLWKKDAEGKDVAVVNTDGQYLYVGRLIANFNKKGELIPAMHDTCASGAFATDKKGVADLGNTPANAKIVEITERIDSIIGPKVRNIIAKTEVFLNAERSYIRRGMTNLGKLSTESMLWYANEFYGVNGVAAIRNAGGIRASIGSIEVKPGSTQAEFLPPVNNQITELDVETALAFDNGMAVVSLTGGELLTQLELSMNSDLVRDDRGEPTTPLQLVVNGKFSQTAGMDIEYDISRPAGKRVTNLTLSNGDKLVTGGAINALNTNKTYRIVTLTFLADGNESIMGDIPAERLQRKDLKKLTPIKEGVFDFAEAGGEQDAFAEYMNMKYSENAYKE